MKFTFHKHGSKLTVCTEEVNDDGGVYFGSGDNGDFQVDYTAPIPGDKFPVVWIAVTVYGEGVDLADKGVQIR